MTLTLVTVNGRIPDVSGVPVTGAVTFAPVAVPQGGPGPLPVTVTDAQDSLVIASAGARRVLKDGAFSVTLAPTDNGALLPRGWGYRVTLQITGVIPDHSFVTLLPFSPDPVDFSALLPEALAEVLLPFAIDGGSAASGLVPASAITGGGA